MTSVHFPSRPKGRFAGWLARTLLVGAWMGSISVAAAAPEALPADLDLVPRDAAAFVHVRVADLWKSEVLGDLRHLFDRAGPEAYKTYIQKVGLDPAIIDRITFVMDTPQTLSAPFPRVDPEAVSALVIVRTSKPYDRLQVRKLLGSREKVYRQHLYYFNEDLWSGLVFLDKQTFLIGSEDALVRFLDRQANKKAEGPLQDALTAAAGKHAFTLGLNPQLLGKEQEVQTLPPPLPKLLEAHCATFTFDLGKESRLTVALNYANDNEAQTGEKTLRDTLDLARAGLAPGIQELEAKLKEPREIDGPLPALTQGAALLVALGMLRELDAQLKDMPVQRQGATVSMAVTSRRTDLASVYILSMGAITTMGIQARRVFQNVGARLGAESGEPFQDPTEIHLKKLAEALDKYQKDKGAYPAAAIYDKEGRPLLSWRVALLPYLDEESLYKEFRLDEPWDSLHNKKLLKKLPKSLKAPDTYSHNKTTDLIFVGDGAAFLPKKGKRKADIAGAAALLVAAGSDNAVYWSKPADLNYADGQPVPNLLGKYRWDSVKMLLANGTLKTVNRETDEKQLREIIKGTAPAPDKN